MPHVQRVLLKDELPNPNDLDQYKPVDTCIPCNGGGKRMIEVEVTETPKQTKEEPYYGC